jgi:hypothetical protein
VALKLDTTGYGENNGIDTIRHYALSPFNINAEIAEKEEIQKMKYPLGIISKGTRFFRAKILRQFNVGFVQNIYDHTDPIYLDGFFQTEKYFKDFETEIRNDLKLSTPFSNEAENIIKTINSLPERQTQSVSLHVRRGDYVKDEKTNKAHGTCGPEYYQKALETIVSKIGTNIHVFVFSDDIEWVKDNLPVSFPVTYVSDPMIKDYEELILMSKCSHNIIANSSFSWWGAWLNSNPNKIVIAPKKWVRKNAHRFKDIIPDQWTKI